MDFNVAVDFVIKHEGGYVNDPKDPGGETRYGISKKANPNVDIKNLTIEQAKEIYRIAYWNPSRAETLPDCLKLVHFDTTVNCGLSAAEDILKKSKGSFEAYLWFRVQRYVSLANKNTGLKKFLNGWLNRVTDIYNLTLLRKEGVV